MRSLALASLFVLLPGSLLASGFEVEFTLDHTFLLGGQRIGVEEFRYGYDRTDSTGALLERVENYCTVLHLGTPPEMAATDFLSSAPIRANFGNWALTEKSITYIGKAGPVYVGLTVLLLMLILLLVVIRKPLWRVLTLKFLSK